MKKMSSRLLLEKLSQFCYVHKTPYTFHNPVLLQQHKYKKGLFTVYDWVDDLCFYYLKKEKSIIQDVKYAVNQKRLKIEAMEDGKYKDGLLDAINEIELFFQTIEYTG